MNTTIAGVLQRADIELVALPLLGNRVRFLTAVLLGLSVWSMALAQGQAPDAPDRGAAGVVAAEPAVGMASAMPPRRPPVRVMPEWGGRQQRLEDEERQLRWIVGAEVNAKPDFFGQSGRGYGLRPVVALEWGRLHASSGGGHSLMGQGRDRNSGRGGAVDGIVRATDRFNVSLGLSVDRGRDGARSDRLQVAPKVPATLRLRVKARYFLGQRWTASVGASQDILGKHGGLKGDVRLAYQYPASQATTITVAAGASFGNGAYMRSQYGVPDTPGWGFTAFRAGGGLYESNLGVDVAHAISRRWVAFGGLGYSHLHGDARRSPLTLHSSGVSASVGVAWRN